MEIEHQQSDSQQEEFKFREIFFSQKKSETWTAETEDTDDDEEFIPNKEESESEEDEIYYMENEAVKEEELDEWQREPYDINLEHYSQMRAKFVPHS